MHEVRLDTLEKVAAWQHEMSPTPIEPWVKWLARSDHGPEYWWQHRERKRAELGLVPSWAKEAKYRQYYVRCSATDPMKIAYTPDAAMGREDRQIKTTPGRFVKKFWPTMTDEQVRAVSDTHRQEFGPPCVYFCFDDDDIWTAYNSGPHSCMSNQNGVRVYDGPDTVIAVIKKGDRITARTVCRIDKFPMEFTRVYGDTVMLTRYLTRLGFKQGNLTGVRLRLQIDNNHSMCPYIDGVQTAKRENGFLKLGEGGANCQQTGSYLVGEASEAYCGHCRVSPPPGPVVQDRRGWNICNRCRQEHYVEAITAASGRLQWVQRADCVSLVGRWFFNNASVLGAHGFVRDLDDRWFPKNEMVYIPNLEVWAHQNEACVPIGCSNPYLQSECRLMPDGRWRKRSTEKELA